MLKLNVEPMCTLYLFCLTLSVLVTDDYNLSFSFSHKDKTSTHVQSWSVSPFSDTKILNQLLLLELTLFFAFPRGTRLTSHINFHIQVS